MSYFTQEQLAEANKYRDAVEKGLVDVFRNGEWHPFITVDRPMGEPWDRVVIHDGQVQAEHIGPMLYAIEWRENGATEKWRQLLQEEKTTPTKFTLHKMRIREPMPNICQKDHKCPFQGGTNGNSAMRTDKPHCTGCDHLGLEVYGIKAGTEAAAMLTKHGAVLRGRINDE